MNVTITTDASYSPQFKVGAYAFWIACDQGRYMHAGPLKEKVSRPEEAEFKCIINSLHFLKGLNLKVTNLYINTDCLNVIHLVNNDTAAIKKYHLKWGHPLLLKYHALLSRAKFGNVTMRHVPAHVATETKRQWVNDWCDRMAKKYLNLELEKTKK